MGKNLKVAVDNYLAKVNSAVNHVNLVEVLGLLKVKLKLQIALLDAVEDVCVLSLRSLGETAEVTENRHWGFFLLRKDC